MTNAELLDILTEIIQRQAEIIRQQRIILMQHGIDGVSAETESDNSTRCLSCPLNGQT